MLHQTTYTTHLTPHVLMSAETTNDVFRNMGGRGGMYECGSSFPKQKPSVKRKIFVVISSSDSSNILLILIEFLLAWTTGSKAR